MQYVIGCFYKAGAPIANDNLKDILEAASLFQTTEVLKKCEEYLKNHIVESTCFQYLYLAETYSLKDVITKADTYILQNFLILRHSAEFKGLEKDGLIQYLQSDRLQIYDDESQVFQAAIDWLEHDTDRMPFATEVMSNVRFEAIPNVQLRGFLEEKIVKENSECQDKIQAAINFHEEDNFRKPLVETCTPARGKEGFIINRSYENGGNIHFKFLSLVTKKTWSSTSPISIMEDSLAGVRVNNYLFLFGTKRDGRNQGAAPRRPLSLRYDATFNTWMELEPVPQEVTAGPAIAHFENEIFFIGGAHSSHEDRDHHYYSSSMEDYDNITNKVWRYGIDTNQWAAAKALPTSVLKAAAVACTADERIYVTGGLKQERHSKVAIADVYAYHMKAGIWIARPPINTARSHHFMETVGEKLYVVGGKESSPTASSSIFMGSIEEYNTIQEQWCIIKVPELFVMSTSMGYVKDKYLYILSDVAKRIHEASSSPPPLYPNLPEGNKTKPGFNILKIDTSTITTLDRNEKQGERKKPKVGKRSSQHRAVSSVLQREQELQRQIQLQLMANNRFHGNEDIYYESDDIKDYYFS